MCKTCEGTHRVAYEGKVGMHIRSCPSCGPMPAEVKAKKDAAFWERFKQAEMQLQNH